MTKEVMVMQFSEILPLRLTSATFCILLMLWMLGGLITVIAFAAVAELCLRAIETQQTQLQVPPDQDHDG
jgi:hypothetical protein